MREKFGPFVGVLAAALLVVGAAQGLSADKYLIEIVVGTGGNGYSGDGGLARDAMIDVYDGGSLALDTSGSIYIADQNTHRVRKIDSSGIITTVAGNGTRGYSGDGGPATAAQLQNPYSIAVDAAGTLYICDIGNDRFRKVDASGIITSFEVSELPGGHGKYPGHTEGFLLYRALGVKVDKEGNLFCATSSRIAMISRSGSVSTVFSGQMALFDMQPSFWTCTFCPDRAGNLYIFDREVNQLYRLDPTGVRTIVAGTGRREYSGDGGQALKASFQDASAVAVDGAGNIYIADVTKPDGGKCVVRKIDAKTGIISRIAGGGYFSISAVGGPATGARLGIMTDIQIDNAGNVYLLDMHGMIWKLYQ